MKIYLNTKKEFKNIEELIQYGYTRNQEKFKRTYLDPKCKIQDCHPARRSFGDLLLICKTYFPKTTEKELAKALFSLNKKTGLRASFCGTINKLVFLKNRKGMPMDIVMDGSIRTRKGQGTHSYSEILQLSKQE